MYRFIVKPFMKLFWVYRVFGLCALIMLFSANARAQDDEPILYETLFLEVFTNDKPLGLIGEFTHEPVSRQLLAEPSQLVGLGVRGNFGKKKLVDLRDIKGLTYEFNYLEQTLHLQLSFEAMQPNVLTPQFNPDFKTVDAGVGLGLNYELSAISTKTSDSVTKSGNFAYDAWAFSPIGTVQSTGYISKTAKEDTVYRRLETRVESVNHDKALRFNIGDATTGGFGWTRPFRFGGIQLRRDFSIRPDIVTIPLLSFEGVATVPSSIDVFIENNRVYSTSTNEGPFALEDIPVIDRNGDAQIVITDVFGNQRSVTQPFFTTSRLLKAGLTDFSISAGKTRLNFGIDNNNYANTSFVTASIRHGFRPDLTLTGHVEAAKDLIFGGVGVAGILFNNIDYEVAIGGSHHMGTTGRFGSISFQSDFDGYRVSGNFLRSSKGTADIAYASSLEAQAIGIGSPSYYPRALDAISLEIPLIDSTQSFSASYTRKKTESEEEAFISAGYTKRFRSNDAIFNARASYDIERDNALLMVGFSKPLGNRTTGSLRTQRSSYDDESYRLSLIRPLSEKTGDYGYSLDVDRTRDETRVSFSTDVRTKFGTLGSQVNAGQGYHRLQSRLTGSLVMAQGKVFAGNRIDRSFAIVDTGVRDLPIYHDGREVTQTNHNGRALVTNLSPYLENQISVSLDDVDNETSFKTTGVTVVPGLRTGAAVDLTVSNKQSDFIAILKFPNGDYIPVGSEASLNGQKDSAIVGFDGVVALSGLRKNNEIKVTLENRYCGGTFERPQDLNLDLEITIC